MSDLIIRSVTRNDVSFSPVVEEIKRREAKGNRYLVVLPTEDNLTDYIKWLSPKDTVEILQRDARADGQAALDYALGGDTGWKERKVLDPETNKEVTQFYYDIADVDFNKYYEVLEKRTLRGGVTKAALLLEQEELTKELRALTFQLASNPTAVGAKMLELGVKLQELDSAIQLRSRTRKEAA